MSPILISPPDFLPDEAKIVCQLFEQGLQRFHIRKQTQEIEEVRLYLKNIPQSLHNQIVLHNHFELLQEFEGLGGLHFNAKNPFSEVVLAQYKGKIFTQACHSFEEIQSLDERISYCFLSPIYDSISKENYRSSFSSTAIKAFFPQYKRATKVVALGGIKPENQAKTLSFGFDKVAVLGYIWDQYSKNGSEKALFERWEKMRNEK